MTCYRGIGSNFRSISKWALVLILYHSLLSLAWAGSTLNFPRFSNAQNTLTGVALFNPSSQNAVVTLTAYGVDGNLVSEAGIQNPVDVTVLAGQQVAALTEELFGGKLQEDTVAWFQASSAVNGLTGFFLYLNTSLTLFDGADLPASSKEIVFNQVSLEAGTASELNLINPGNAAASLTLKLQTGGNNAIEKTLELPAKGVARLDALEAFDVDASDDEAYVRVTSNVPVAGFEFIYSDDGDVFGLNASSVADVFDELYFPQFAVLGPWETQLCLVNYSTESTVLTISALDSQGQLFGAEDLRDNPAARGLEGGQIMCEDAAAMFGFQGSETREGWIKVEASRQALNGYVRYGVKNAGSIAAVSAEFKGRTEAIFSHIATAAGYFTGLAVLNPGSLAADVRVLAIKSSGEVIGSYDTVIPPGQRFSQVINQLIPKAAGLTGGLIWVQSSVPVFMTSLFGRSGILANIPPQPSPLSYRPDRGLQRMTLSPKIAIVQPSASQTFQSNSPSGLEWRVNGVSGGSSTVGSIGSNGLFTAPATIPDPQAVTITASSANQTAGATVDILQLNDLAEGLGAIQSVAFLSSLQRLYEAELSLQGVFDSTPFSTSRLPAETSTVFEVIPPSTKKSIAGFPNENVAKLLAYEASNGLEYLLAAGKALGRLIRLDPRTGQYKVVLSSMNEPTSMVFDPVGENLLVAHAGGITKVPRSTLEDGLPAGTASEEGGGPSASGAVTGSFAGKFATLPVSPTSGIEVDACTGGILFSNASQGKIQRYDRDSGAVETVAEGLQSPGQMLALYRTGVSCPEATHLLVIERGAGRISLVIPSSGLVREWMAIPEATDLAFVPSGSSVIESPAVLIAERTSTSSGRVRSVGVPGLYRRGRPINPPRFEDFGVQFSGVVVGQPVFSQAVSPQAAVPGSSSVSGLNIKVEEIISDPGRRLRVGDIVTVTWSALPPFSGLEASTGDRIRIQGRYMVDPIPESYSNVGDHWVTISLIEHAVQPVIPDSLLFLSTGEMFEDDEVVNWSGAGGLNWDCCGCNVEHSGTLPAGFPVAKVKAVTFLLTDSQSNSFIQTVEHGPTRLALILNNRTAEADSRPSLPGETAPLDLPWVIRFEFPEPVQVLPGATWSLVDGDDNALSAVLLHMSDVVSSANLESGLPGTTALVNCEYSFSEPAWYSVKFELQ